MDVVSLLKEKLQSAINEEYSLDVSLEDIHIECPENSSWGDYATNVSLMLAAKLKQSPMDVAKKLSYKMQEIDMTFNLEEISYPIFGKTDIATPGFINFTFSKEFLLWQLIKDADLYSKNIPQSYIGSLGGQKVLYEYTDPNPFKVFHIGHLMSNAIGESLTRLSVFNGAEVKRANYQGDVGIHIAKSIWGVFKKFEKENTSLLELEKLSLDERIAFLGEAYSLGASVFEENEEIQKEIKQLNTQVYMAAQENLVETEGWEPVVDYSKFLQEAPKFPYEDVKQIYIKGRAWSLENFEKLYDKLGTKFDFYFFESKVGEFGLNLVKEQLKNGVFEEDQGAVIFKGEKYGLHTRVFMNSLGLPVYEAKDLSLPIMKMDLFKYDRSYIVTANEINEYFKVVLKAMEQFNPDLAQKTTHIGHGVMKFKSGKMSSRTGEIVTGVTLLEEAENAALVQMESSNSSLSKEEKPKVAQQLGVGAVKYSILKHNAAKDIIYDPEQSISVTGNTGPYLQYTHARANSVLEKAGSWKPNSNFMGVEELDATELAILKHLAQFEQVALRASLEISPSLMSEYLFELAQKFNAFYNDVSILNSEDETLKTLRLSITKQVKVVLKVGLWLLGIQAPDRV